MQQHKLELKGKNFFVRGYTTTEDGGRSYDMTFTALNINRQWKDQIKLVYRLITAFALCSTTLAGQTPEQALMLARNFADYNIFPVNSFGSSNLQEMAQDFNQELQNLKSF
jgi:hypothetical protein